MSIPGQIAERISAAVTALALSPGTLSAKVRKVLAVSAGDAAAVAAGGVVVITVGAEGEEEPVSRSCSLWHYPVGLALVTETAKTLHDPEVIWGWRDQLVALLQSWDTYAGVFGFNNALVRGGVPFDPTGLSQNWNSSWLGATVEILK